MTMELLTITTRRLPMDSLSYWPLRFVRPEWRDDEPLAVHEGVHQLEQMLAFALASTALCVIGSALDLSLWWALLLVINPWWVLYAFPSFRLRAEARAYRAQLALRGRLTRERAARYLAENYKLNITAAEAERLLTGD